MSRDNEADNRHCEYGDAIGDKAGLGGTSSRNISSNISFLSTTLLPLRTSDDEFSLARPATVDRLLEQHYYAIVTIKMCPSPNHNVPSLCHAQPHVRGR